MVTVGSGNLMGQPADVTGDGGGTARTKGPAIGDGSAMKVYART